MLPCFCHNLFFSCFAESFSSPVLLFKILLSCSLNYVSRYKITDLCRCWYQPIAELLSIEAWRYLFTFNSSAASWRRGKDVCLKSTAVFLCLFIPPTSYFQCFPLFWHSLPLSSFHLYSSSSGSPSLRPPVSASYHLPACLTVWLMLRGSINTSHAATTWKEEEVA